LSECRSIPPYTFIFGSSFGFQFKAFEPRNVHPVEELAR
jgi:hypothetical protein